MKLSSNTLPLLVAGTSLFTAALLHNCDPKAESLNEDAVFVVRDRLLKACGGSLFSGPETICDGSTYEGDCELSFSEKELVFAPEGGFHSKVGVDEGGENEGNERGVIVDRYLKCIEAEIVESMLNSDSDDAALNRVVFSVRQNDCDWGVSSNYNRTNAATNYESDSVRVSSFVDCSPYFPLSVKELR